MSLSVCADAHVSLDLIRPDASPNFTLGCVYGKKKKMHVTGGPSGENPIEIFQILIYV